MNRTFFLLIFTLFIDISVYSQTEMLLGDAFSDGLEKYNHIGRIDSVIESNFNVKVVNDSISKGSVVYDRAKAIVKFDKDENVVELKDLISNDELLYTYRYRYDKKSRLIERKVINSKEETVAKLSINYKTDALIEVSHFDGDQKKPVTKWLFEIDRKKMSATERRSFPTDSLIDIKFKLDSNNKLIQKEDDSYQWIYKYDSKGLLTDVEIIPLIQIDYESRDDQKTKIKY